MRGCLAGLLLLSFFVSVAGAADLPCGPADAGAVRLDGLTEDWSEVTGIEVGRGDPNLSFTAKCNIIGPALYLLVDVRDNRFVRTSKAGSGEDHVELLFGSGQKIERLLVYPGNARTIKDRVRWASGRPAKGVKAISALQERGWAVELTLPLAAIPGLRSGMPRTRFAIRVADSDSMAARKTERVIESSPTTSVSSMGYLSFAEGEAALDEFLKERGLKPSDIFWDKSASLGRQGGARVLMAGHFLVAVTDGYSYSELPFKERRDLKDVRLIDLAGDGRQALVIRYVERGSGGSREVLAVYRFIGDAGFQRLFAAEVGKSVGTSHVEDRVSFVRRGAATDIMVEAAGATGFTQANWHEAPAEDFIPVLLPWADDHRARYEFHGDEYQRAH